jgi:hypothetical protein
MHALVACGLALLPMASGGVMPAFCCTRRQGA